MQKKAEVLRIENINTTEKAGVALRRLRKLKKLSQAELARMMGMRQPTISDIESGKGTLESFFRIIQALKINISFSGKTTSKSPGVKTKIGRMLDYLEEGE